LNYFGPQNQKLNQGPFVVILARYLHGNVENFLFLKKKNKISPPKLTPGRIELETLRRSTLSGLKLIESYQPKWVREMWKTKK
jgi:hypothetical protein